MGKNTDNLARKVKKGDETAFKKVYDQYHRQLFYVAKRYLKDKSHAEDAVQDLFLKLWNNRNKIDKNASSLKGWLYTMMKNHLVDLIRKKETREEVQKQMQITADNKQSGNRTEDRIIYQEYRQIVHQGLLKLSPAKKKVFKLRGYDGLSNAEVAKINDVSVHTVKTQFYLGSKFIRNYLKKHAGI